MPTFEKVISEVRGGLTNERPGIECAYANLDFYNGDNEQYIEIREGEDQKSFEQRRRRTMQLTTMVIDVLCRHLYNPGPTRKLQNATANAWFEDIARKLDVNALWQEADKLAILNDYCAFQMFTDEDPEKPVKVHLWGREELCVWTDEDDPTKPKIVCTIDRIDAQTRYRIWDAEQYCTLQTKKFDQSRPARTRERMGDSDRNPVMVEEPKPHGYGVLPFVFVHARPPVRRFEAPGIGTPLRRANQTIDAILCDLSESIQYYARPILVGRNLRPDWRPVFRAGGIVRLEGDRTTVAMGEQPPEPMIDPLVVPIDIESLWADINHQIDRILECFGVPKAAVRMEQQTAASGAAIIAEQKPLYDRARARRPQFQRYESEFASMLCRFGHMQTRVPALEGAANDPGLTLTWPEPTIDAPGPDRDTADRNELDMGITSRVRLLMERRGLTKDQAQKALIEIAEEEDFYQTLFGAKEEPVNGQDDGQGQGQTEGQQGQEQGQTEDDATDEGQG